MELELLFAVLSNYNSQTISGGCFNIIHIVILLWLSWFVVVLLQVTPGSCPTISFMEHASSCNTALPHETSSGNNRHLQGQLSAPDEENTTHSAPMACGGLTVPSFKRTFSMEAGYYKNYYSGGAFYTKVSKKAEEIISKFEKMRMDSSETVHTQSPSPVEQPEEENIIQYPVPEVSTPSMGILQRQLSEFPLDQVLNC